MLNNLTLTDPVLHLYNHDYPPTEADTASDYTEPTEDNYAAITLTGASWTVSTSGGGVTTASYSEQTFTFVTNVDIYGYFVTNTSGSLLWAEEFTGSPFQLPDQGGQIAISPRISLE